ncbi:hypothetical protein [Carboxylicivirga linearis]|uniref:Uncharacterized protein n=1 Tax=Carboxylicivirga linearis TaxID=1628157 RepID=A0ABS5JW17_9BACT|nr:hypothetical protein [Carboxylicivirga linearis]MBS2099096.1 hypothetical protein [Carboxylicivirga linearis]
MSVKKEKLLERSEFFSFSETDLIFSNFHVSAALLVYFFLLQRRSKSLRGLSAIENKFVYPSFLSSATERIKVSRHGPSMTRLEFVAGEI